MAKTVQTKKLATIAKTPKLGRDGARDALEQLDPSAPTQRTLVRGDGELDEARYRAPSMFYNPSARRPSGTSTHDIDHGHERSKACPVDCARCEEATRRERECLECQDADLLAAVNFARTVDFQEPSRILTREEQREQASTVLAHKERNEKLETCEQVRDRQRQRAFDFRNLMNDARSIQTRLEEFGAPQNALQVAHLLLAELRQLSRNADPLRGAPVRSPRGRPVSSEPIGIKLVQRALARNGRPATLRDATRLVTGRDDKDAVNEAGRKARRHRG